MSLMRFLPIKLRTLTRQRWARGRGGSERETCQKCELNRFKLERDIHVCGKRKMGGGEVKIEALSAVVR